ncbi:hypothetical protein Pst134EA_007106 [Puccinia striiformis f. sp. tritici]|uniref:NAD(+) diphosphatase n=1 Tax=Puccinia striiformis f. sp. tritici PST-78 TaxID=1165861 RepID=A0A0L0VEI9_9BASI|nr:hypothetical protein Pst134EA_007106 [Puccinia striiformis f. sp. tritici]KAH9469829.1 hypothetical protein Pst134EA_007106 [Puccinia striiformis f. sp. tritici]KNE97727.1 hypothetical protein PSTG_08947 [Puccinia striiformis f. sp. tritici PST-78]
MSDVQNYYSGGSTNRLSWMRQSGSFLSSALSSPQAKFILFHNLKPLVIDQLSSEPVNGFPVSHKLSSLPWQEVASVLNPTGLAIVEPGEVVDLKGTMWPKQLTSRSAKSRQPILGQFPIVIFLGTDASSEQPDVNKPLQPSHGSPIWAIDVTGIHEKICKTSILGHGKFLDMKKVNLALNEANLAAQARAMIDWNARNKFCAACGRPTYSAWAGWKLACTSNLEKNGQSDDVKDPGSPPECVTANFSIQNFCYPRTDPVCIMGVTNSTGDSILLGRKSVWPPGHYSCLAGFIEPGESIEDCCKREVLEESGVGVDSVNYHSSQPWPFPGSLMIGVMCRAVENSHIRLDLDKELEDARFFPRSVILGVLDPSKKVEFTEDELRRFDDNYNPSDSHGTPITDPTVDLPTSTSVNKIQLTIPAPTAIAHHIIRSWAMGVDRAKDITKIYEKRPNF